MMDTWLVQQTSEKVERMVVWMKLKAYSSAQTGWSHWIFSYLRQRAHRDRDTRTPRDRNMVAQKK